MEDDGVYDWDVLKRHQEQQGAPGASNPPDPPLVESNSMGAKGPGGDPPMPSGSGSNISPRASGPGGKVSGSGDGEGGAAAPAKRSLISSIRHSLFGSKNGARAEGASISAPSQSNNNKR